MQQPQSRPPNPLAEVAILFLKLGCIAFGGPAAHIAMMRDETVRRRGWLSDQQFLDLIGAANLIPGPTSTEVGIFLGYTRAGWRGLVLAGGLFIAPAMLIVLTLAWAYVEYGSTPQAAALLYGVKPVIIAVIVQALWGLARTAVKSVPLAAIGAGSLALYFSGAPPVLILFGGALLVLLVENRSRLPGFSRAVGLLPLLPFPLPPAAAAVPLSLPVLFLAFFKLSLFVYGSGYLLLAFLRADFVQGLGWLNDQQILDAVAVGQFTPGPVFTTATFLGYLLAGVPGALIATAAVFLPGFLLVAAVFPAIPRLRRSPWAGAFLDGANVTAVALMAGVAWDLGLAAITDLMTAALGVAAAALLIRFKLNSAWLVAGGGVAGLLASFVRTGGG